MGVPDICWVIQTDKSAVHHVSVGLTKARPNNNNNNNNNNILNLVAWHVAMRQEHSQLREVTLPSHCDGTFLAM